MVLLLGSAEDDGPVVDGPGCRNEPVARRRIRVDRRPGAADPGRGRFFMLALMASLVWRFFPMQASWRGVRRQRI
jgi:hypothetical protein